MVSPVPGKAIGTPYGQRGPYWSCQADASGNGIHTGVDYPAATGTPVVAARGGTVVHCSHGAAFGSHQIEIRPGDGTRDFYAHLSSRIGDGSKVAAGDRVGAVGAEGNVTGPHLHFERHTVASGGWSCGIITSPLPSINAHSPSEEVDPMPLRVTGTSKNLALNGDWQIIDWENLSGYYSGLIAPGGSAFKFVGPFLSTFAATITGTEEGHGVVVTRPAEGNMDGPGGSWEIVNYHRPAETAISGDTTFHVDTRADMLSKGDRVQFQIRGPAGMRAEDLRVTLLYWD